MVQYKFVDRDGDDYVLYHGSSWEHIDSIIYEGLRGGDNTKGGTHGVWDTPTLFLARDEFVARKYGVVVQVLVTKEELDHMERINDGLGDPCFLIEGEGILIAPKRLRCLEWEHAEGMCDGPGECEFCEEDD